MSVITIDTEEIAKLAMHGTEVALEEEAETALARLIFLHNQLGTMIAQVKEDIAQKAVAMDSNFSSMKGDKLKVEYRAFGAEFAMPKPLLVDKEFRTEKTTYSIDTKRVKAYETDTGMLPVGIERVERKKQITIKEL